MSSYTRKENNTKALKNPLATSRIQLNSNLEKLINENKVYNEQIKKLDESIQKALENKEILIKENAYKRAVYNAEKKTTDIKRDFLSSIINNQKSSNESFDKIRSKFQEFINKNPHIYGNISNLNQCKNHLLSKILIIFLVKTLKFIIRNNIRIMH